MKEHQIISILFMTISLCIFSYTFYYSEIAFGSTRHYFYLKYYVVSIVCVILSFASFFIGKELKIKIFLVSTSIVFSFYIVELYLGIQFKSKFDHNNYDVVTEYKKKSLVNKNLTIAMLPRQINKNLHSLGGISNKETIYCNEHGYFTNFKSDRYGFNNNDEVWDADEIEYLLVGDSFLLGSCVRKNDTIAGNLSNLIKHQEILNLGYSGNGPLLEYASLKEYLPELSVNNIVWIYYEGNDFSELKRRLNNKLLGQYLKDYYFKQNLVNKQNIIDEDLNTRVSNLVKDSYDPANFKPNYLKNFLKLYNLRVVFFEPFFEKPNYQEFEKIIINTQKFVKENNSNFFFVYIPTYESLSNFYFSRHKKNYKKVIEIIQKENIILIDMLEEFKNINDPLKIFPFKDDGHLNRFGYKIIANSITTKKVN
jgi:hypothetical protein